MYVEYNITLNHTTGVPVQDIYLCTCLPASPTPLRDGCRGEAQGCASEGGSRVEWTCTGEPCPVGGAREGGRGVEKTGGEGQWP